MGVEKFMLYHVLTILTRLGAGSEPITLLTVILTVMLMIFYLDGRTLVEQNLTVSRTRFLLCKTNCAEFLQLIVE